MNRSAMQSAPAHETSLAGAIMLLVGGILLFYLLGNLPITDILPVFLIGIGAIFTVLGLFTLREPRQDERIDDLRAFIMLPRAYLLYGILAIMTGAVWIAWPIHLLFAQYLLAGLLILFGVIFLIYAGLTFRYRYPNR
jgi:hypothetical protein